MAFGQVSVKSLLTKAFADLSKVHICSLYHQYSVYDILSLLPEPTVQYMNDLDFRDIRLRTAFILVWAMVLILNLYVRRKRQKWSPG